MHKLLIADSNEEFRLALAEALQLHFHVFTCGSGTQALELLRREAPDVFLLDLMLPELDGITLLETAEKEGIHPQVLIASGMLTDYVYACMERLGIRYMMRKPCDISALSRRLLDLNRESVPRKKPSDLRSRISRLLLWLSLNAKHHGYGYLLVALPMVMENPGISVTKELYPKVAKHFDCKPRHIERSIRSAIEAGWKHRDPAIWEQLFPGAVSRPSNADFLARIAEELLQETE